MLSDVACGKNKLVLEMVNDPINDFEPAMAYLYI